MKIKVDTSKLLKQVEAFGRVQKRLQSIADKLGAMGRKNDWDDIYDGIAESIKHDVSTYSANLLLCANASGSYLSFITDSCKEYNEIDKDITSSYKIKSINNTFDIGMPDSAKKYLLENSFLRKFPYNAVKEMNNIILIQDNSKYPSEIAGIRKGNPMTFEQANYFKENPNLYDENCNLNYEYATNCQRCVPVFILRLLGYDLSAKPNLKDNDNNGLLDEGYDDDRKIKNGRELRDDEKKEIEHQKNNTDLSNLGSRSNVYKVWLDGKGDPIDQYKISVEVSSSNGITCKDNIDLGYYRYENLNNNSVNYSDLANQIDKNISCGEIHQMCFQRAESAHTICIGKDQDGKMFIHDPQCGDTYYNQYSQQKTNSEASLDILGKYFEDQKILLDKDMFVSTLRVNDKQPNLDIINDIVVGY